MPAGRVRRGDRVRLRGRSLEVKAVRDKPSASGRRSVVLVPRVGLSQRLRAAVLVLVDRDGRAARRGERGRRR